MTTLLRFRRKNTEFPWGGLAEPYIMVNSAKTDLSLNPMAVLTLLEPLDERKGVCNIDNGKDYGKVYVGSLIWALG